VAGVCTAHASKSSKLRPVSLSERTLLLAHEAEHWSKPHLRTSV
jgi:hypothetical protein